jgi:hypothetical protein
LAARHQVQEIHQALELLPSSAAERHLLEILQELTTYHFQRQVLAVLAAAHIVQLAALVLVGWVLLAATVQAAALLAVVELLRLESIARLQLAALVAQERIFQHF